MASQRIYCFGMTKFGMERIHAMSIASHLIKIFLLTQQVKQYCHCIVKIRVNIAENNNEKIK